MDTITAQDVVNGRIVDQHGRVDMADGTVYFGPIWRWIGETFVIYRNRPVDVFRSDHPNAENNRWVRR